MYNADVTAGYSTFIGHLPYSEKAIEKSVTKLIGQNNNIPDFSEGYNKWKDAWDKGEGGYFTIDLKEAIDGVDSSMRQKR